MFARTMDSIWREHLDAAHETWDRLVHRSADGSQRLGSDASPPSRLHRKLVGGLAAALAVLALTYSAASALVSGAADSSTARTDYAMVLQAASAKYRSARAACLALPVERRDACIAEAHADEARMRSAATVAPRKQLAKIRSESGDTFLAAVANDSIVIEPACSIVARGTASVCEIQVSGSSLDAQNALIQPRLIQASADTSHAQSRPIQASGTSRAAQQPSVSMVSWRAGADKNPARYLASVSVMSP